MIGNIVLVNSGFHTHKNFTENYPCFGHTPSNISASPVLGQKSFKVTGFKRCLAGAPVCLQPLLSAGDAAMTAECELWLVEF